LLSNSCGNAGNNSGTNGQMNDECRDDRHGQRLLLRRLLAKCEGEWQQRNRLNREPPKGDLTPKAPGRL
jgi:hypothetical protein